MDQHKTEKQIQFQLWLQQEFTRRCRVNSRYSIRSYAKHLDINQSTLSQILNGKRRVSDNAIPKFEQKLGIPFHFQSQKTVGLDFNYATLSADIFTVISDWHHYAILELTEVKGARNDALWISQRIGISSAQAKMAIERLVRLNLLVEEKGKLKKTQTFITNYKEGETSGAHKEFQRQIITKALQAIDICPADKKDITSITMPANSKKLKEAKEKIRQFRRELCAFLEDGNHDSVFQLCIQLYPLTHSE